MPVYTRKVKRTQPNKAEALITFFFIFTFLKMAWTLQVFANMAPKAVV